MKNSTLSILVFAIYGAILSLLLVFYPKVFLLLGFKSVSGPFVRTLGYIIGTIAFFYFMAAREQARSFYRWSIYARLPLLPFFITLVAFGIGPPIMILIGAWDSGCALWTALALNRESRNRVNTVT